jgi:LysR family nitrogen assimilation transcriptional regulator
VKVVEAGNITRAAEQLNVAQPALGLQIRQLEQDLGVDLLLRHSRGVAPTEAGRILFERASTILGQIEETRREISRLVVPTQEMLRLGLSPSIMLQLGPEMLLDARDEMPGVFLSLVEELSFALSEGVERGELDMAFAYEVSERAGLDIRPVLREELLFVTARKGDAVAETITLREALTQDLVLAGGRDIVRRLVEAEAEKLSIKLRVTLEAQSISAMKSLVARGAAACIMPYGTAVEELKAGVLTSRRIVHPAILRTLYLVRPARPAAFHHLDSIERFLCRIQQRLSDSLGTLARPASAE